MLRPHKRPLPLESAPPPAKRARTLPTVSAQDTATSKELSSRAVVALVTLTDPTIVTNIMRLMPCESKRGLSCVLGTLVNLCRAVGPFDHALPRFFGPRNQVFWREMVLQSFDFTPSQSYSQEQPLQHPDEDRLDRWPRLSLIFRPSEYGFLSQLQQGDRADAVTSWPEREDAFTLFCDLALVVGKMRRVVSLHDEGPYLYPCLLKSLGSDRPSPPPLQDVRSIVIPPMITRSSRRAYLTRLIVRKLRRWTSVDDRLFVGRSKQSRRWLGFAVCTGPRSQQSPP